MPENELLNTNRRSVEGGSERILRLSDAVFFPEYFLGFSFYPAFARSAVGGHVVGEYAESPEEDGKNWPWEAGAGVVPNREEAEVDDDVYGEMPQEPVTHLCDLPRLFPPFLIVIHQIESLRDALIRTSNPPATKTAGPGTSGEVDAGVFLRRRETDSPRRGGDRRRGDEIVAACDAAKGAAA